MALSSGPEPGQAVTVRAAEPGHAAAVHTAAFALITKSRVAWKDHGFYRVKPGDPLLMYWFKVPLGGVSYPEGFRNFLQPALANPQITKIRFVLEATVPAIRWDSLFP